MPKNKKSLGQNWLKDRDTLLAIAEMAAAGEHSFSAVKNTTTTGESLGRVSKWGHPKVNQTGRDIFDIRQQKVVPQQPPSQFCLEIGPGLGTLTSALFKYFDEIIAVEFDKNLAEKLPNSFPGKNLQVIHADILDFDLDTLPKDYVVAGNIPYYITSPIIQKFLHAKNRPSRITLLIQKEVAQRLAVKPGEYSILGLSAQIYAKVSLGPIIKRELFTPAPKVDSQIVVLEPKRRPLATERTMALIKLGFTAPRKKLATNLSVTLQCPRSDIFTIFGRIGIPTSARPADLSINDWLDLQKRLTIIHS